MRPFMNLQDQQPYIWKYFPILRRWMVIVMNDNQRASGLQYAAVVICHAWTKLNCTFVMFEHILIL